MFITNLTRPDPVLAGYFEYLDRAPQGWGPFKRVHDKYLRERHVLVRGRFSGRVHLLQLAVNDFARRELADAMRIERDAEARILAGWQEDDE